MWFADTDVPLALVEAQREGSLVIFVGAGASMGTPSSLPDFRTLTAAIAADASVTPTPEELNQPDVLLGDLERPARRGCPPAGCQHHRRDGLAAEHAA